MWWKVAVTPEEIKRGVVDFCALPAEENGRSDEEVLSEEWDQIRAGRVVKVARPRLALLPAPKEEVPPPKRDVIVVPDLEAVREEPPKKGSEESEAFQIHMATYLRLNSVFADTRNPVNGLLVARHGDDWCFGASNAHVAVLWGAFAVFGHSREPLVRAYDWSGCNSQLGPKLADKHGFGRLAPNEAEGRPFPTVSALVRKLLTRAEHGEEGVTRHETLNVRNLQKALTTMGLVAGAEVRISMGCGPTLIYNREKDVIAIVTASSK